MYKLIVQIGNKTIEVFVSGKDKWEAYYNASTIFMLLLESEGVDNGWWDMRKV